MDMMKGTTMPKRSLKLMNGKIGFDLDGVLYDWHRVTYEFVVDSNKNFDVPFDEFWTDWLNQDENHMLADFLMMTPIFVTKIIMSDTMRNTLWTLAETNELFYITARPQEVHSGTEWWIKSSRIPNPENLIFAKDKLPHIINNEIAIFVEDMVKHALALQNHTEVILVEKPWNTIIQEEFPTIFSVNQLPELLETV